MKKIVFAILLFLSQLSFSQGAAVPDTVTVGFYINSLHDIDFREKEYTINMWLWLKYKNPDFDFSKYLEVPMAKEVDKSFYTVDTLADGRIYMLMKLQCVMRDSWEIQNFPFDRQKMRFTIENSQYDTSELVFQEDSLGKHYSKWSLSGWRVIDDSLKIDSGIKKYQTGFGDPAYDKPYSEFSNFKVIIAMERDSWWLFLKLFLGMYISFMLSFLCFFVHSGNIDSRFGLSVGALFAVIGNKYVVDSTLPETTSFTLVDMLHGITLFCVFAVVACSAYVLRLLKTNRESQIKTFDKRAATVLMLCYLILNLWFILTAYNAPPA